MWQTFHQMSFSATSPTATPSWPSGPGILGERSIPIKTIVVGGEVAGHILCWTDDELGKPDVSYWIGKEHWGKGIATRALARFLEQVTGRPIYGRAASDNVASLRVLEKCGFRLVGTTRGFANARGEEVDELILELRPAE